jgi:two-component system sensor histidine kinase AlgZ
MHPILSPFRRLGLYLLAWAVLGFLFAYLLRLSGEFPWREAFVLALPLCILYALICLSAWYPCRGTPINTSSLARIAGTNLAAAAIAATLGVLAAKLFALQLSETPAFAGLDARLAPRVPILFATGVLLYLLSVAFYYVILAVEASREAEARAAQASLLAREAELRALKAQVNPHFLFNSLNSISALTSSDPPRAREMCILLGDFLRATLGLGEKSAIPLSEEMSLIRAFLAVEKIRFGARLDMREKIDERALACGIPPLLLQPLVENAVAHGVANLAEGGSILLDVQCQDAKVSILIENSFDPEAPPWRRSGVGLANVRQRLAARYGDRASMSAKGEGGIFRVAIVLPAEKEARTP